MCVSLHVCVKGKIEIQGFVMLFPESTKYFPYNLPLKSVTSPP